MARFRLKEPYSFFHGRDGFRPPYEFEAPENDPEVVAQRYKLERMDEVETPTVADDVVDPAPEEPVRRRRGRPRKLNRAMAGPPYDGDVGSMDDGNE